MPLVSVIMPVYNCEGFVREAVDSILQQSFSDFEFFIIDDASKDSTASIIQSYNDPRIQFIRKPVNTGYTDSLNMGLKLATGTYIARMDGDDIASPDRFELQVAALKADPGIVVCGTGIEIIGTGEQVMMPVNNEEIKVRLLTLSCLAHPTVMFKRSFVLDNGLSYNKSREPAEDYDLWVRILKKGGMLTNIAQPLLRYRVHVNQTSHQRQVIAQESALITKAELLSSIVSLAAARKFYGIATVINSKKVDKEIAYLHWLDNENKYLVKRNQEKQFFDQQRLQAFLDENRKKVIRIVFLHSKKYNFKKLFVFIKYIRNNPGYFSVPEMLKNMAKCITAYSIK